MERIDVNKPVRRVYIPKPKGGKRPLGVPSGDNKLVQEVVRIILERIYEPIFSNHSHGFRPNRSCHTALEQVKRSWTGVKWFIEFDIKGFFDNMNHDIMVRILEKKIDDRRFIKLIKAMMKAGYIEDWVYNPTYSGVPQGGIVSPIMSNIYLTELDYFIMELKQSFDRGKKRPNNPEYKRVLKRKYRLRKKMNEIGKKPELLREYEELSERQRRIPSGDTESLNYKRLMYCRYADDFICGIIGTKSDAEFVIGKIEEFLHKELDLQLSEEKTRISHATSEIQFLSYGIVITSTDKIMKIKNNGTIVKRRTVQGRVRLTVPTEKVIRFCNKYKYGEWYKNKPLHRAELRNASDVEIVLTYNAELRGLANYYALANDVKGKQKKLEYLANYSLLKTLAVKHKTELTTILQKFRHNGEFIRQKGDKEYKVFRLRHLEKPKRDWQTDIIPNTLYLTATRTELTKRMEAQKCEYCGIIDDKCQSHHVRKLKDLKPDKLWKKVMIYRHRKTIILCLQCHKLLHKGTLPDNRFKPRKGEQNLV